MYNRCYSEKKISFLFEFASFLQSRYGAVSNNISFERKGGVLGVASSFQIFGNMTGPIIGGYAAGVVGLKPAFIFTGLIFLLIALLIFTKLSD